VPFSGNEYSKVSRLAPFTFSFGLYGNVDFGINAPIVPRVQSIVIHGLINISGKRKSLAEHLARKREVMKFTRGRAMAGLSPEGPSLVPGQTT
jgi:hypothetical protein